MVRIEIGKETGLALLATSEGPLVNEPGGGETLAGEVARVSEILKGKEERNFAPYREK